MASLLLEQVALGYPQRMVLQGIDLSIDPGEILAVVGPNSVGKSTLIKGASGILAVQSGSIQVHGRELETLPLTERARLVAVVPQATNLPPAFTAFEVVLMGRTPYLGWLARESPTDREIARRAMDRTNTTELAGRPVGELSGGEQQRVLLARALAQASNLLLLDEPTAHLDLKHQDDVLKLVRQLAKEEGLTVLVTLHDLNLVARFADRVALLSNGRIRKMGQPEQVLTPEELAAVYGITLHVTSHPRHGTPVVLYDD